MMVPRKLQRRSPAQQPRTRTGSEVEVIAEAEASAAAVVMVIEKVGIIIFLS